MDIGLIGGALAAGQAGQGAKRQSHIIQEIEQMHKALAYLDDKMDVLGGRLEPVLRHLPPPNENKQIQVDLENIVSLAANIRDQRLAVERIAQTVCSFLERIEL